MGKEKTRLVSELIADGKLKRINHLNISLVVLTTGYVVEEDTNPWAIMFIRYYLGHNNIFGNFSFSEKYKGKTHREILMMHNKEAYESWLEENKEKLEITKNL